METVILVVHLLIALALIGVVLMQRSEGGALGIGGGGSGSLFTARGAANTLTRLTAYLAIAFFITSIALTWISTHRGSTSVFDQAPAQGQSQPATGEGSSTAPAAPPAQPTTPQVPVSQ
jgi:preprotein translocase subunit SecG